MRKNIRLIGVGLIGLSALIIKNEVEKKRFPKISYHKKIAGNFNALALPPFGIYISEKEKGNEILLNHELIHWEQYQKLGLVRFYLKYQIQLAKYGYDRMPMEKEARVDENEWVKENYTMAVRNGYAKTAFNPCFRK